MNCPFCEKTETRLITFSDDYPAVRGDRDGPRLRVDGLEGYECPGCGEVMMDMAQVRYNEARIAAARSELNP